MISTVKKTASAMLLATQASFLAAEERPNIVLIFVDDLGYGDLSCQGFAKDIHTPHIDKLLNEGVRFTNFHANCPVSSPSRASLLTGRYPDMVGVPGVIRTHETDSWGYLSSKAVLLPQMTKKQGYKSAIIGKWHLGLESPNTPTERGFDYFHGFLGDMMDDYYTHLRFGHNYMRENNQTITAKGHATDVFTDWTLDYFEQQKGSEAPFFLYLAYNAPHTPIQPPADWIEKVKQREKGISDTRASLVALIEHLDHNIGRIYKTLEENNQLEETLIIFMSDNGGQADCSPNNGDLRGFKQDMYEGGLRVPAGIYWKGKIEPAVNDNFLMHMDIMPTLCDLLDISIEHKIDGISALPLLMGKEQTTDERIVHWVRREGNMQYGGKAYYASQYRGYKLLQDTPYKPLELYNLNDDPREEKNIADKSHPEYIRLFKAMMEHIRLSGGIPWTKP